MKFLPLITASLIAAEAVSASLEHAARHPAGHLFARHNRREPVELYKGEDPQLHLVTKRSDVPNDSPIRQKRDFLELESLRPTSFSKRQAPTNSPGTGTPYPPAGPDAPAANTLPQAWVDKYNKAKAAGLIPNIPPATENAAGTTDYNGGVSAKDACSWTSAKCYNGDIYQAPDNSVALGIDDGPTPNGTAPYLDVLSSNNVTATHFLIGSAIYWNSDVLKTLANATPKQNLGVHTWSHTLQTTKTDMQVLGDLGWTMQIIYDYTGCIPAYWRPPEGDVDNRVRAIAKYVFGMQTVMWTHDADDWCLRQGKGTATTVASCATTAPNLKTVRANQVAWATPKTNNTGWITLNHETTDQSAKAFKSMIAAIKQAGWTLEGAVPDLQGLPWYNNAYSPNDAPSKQANILPTRDFINVTDATAAKGSAQAPKLGNWAKNAAASNPAVGSQLSGSNDSGSSSSSKSSAATIRVSSAVAGLALVAAGLAVVA